MATDERMYEIYDENGELTAKVMRFGEFHALLRYYESMGRTFARNENGTYRLVFMSKIA